MNFKLHLLETITNNFSDENKVGSGGYGEVYKGKHNDEEIAVKKLYTLEGLDDKEFHNELRTLSKVEHQNIVRLIGYCYESHHKYVQHNGEQVFVKVMERLLCFEYMKGGSLEKHITDESCDLDWTTCYRIIKGTSDGLNHLHSSQANPIFHLDLKPANILLDDNMTAKIADLGLSRLVASTKTLKTNTIKGTQGYMPPEYIDGGDISNKFDVFSLGVIMLKLMDGNKAHSRFFEMGAEQFIKHVNGNWKNRLHATSVHAWESYSVQIKECTEIALSCVEADRNKRPSIGVIVDKLNETETAIQYPHVLRNEPGTSMDQGRRHTHTAAVEEEKRERKGVSETENCFGEVVDDYKLDKMARYKGKLKTQEDRAREAWNLVNEDDKDAKASSYVDNLKAMYGNGQSTLCLVYNATGDTLYLVANHDWFGYIGRAPYPAEIGNGQWAAFHHVHKTGDPSGSVAAVVYRGKKRDGQDQDYLVAWSTPWGFWYRNKAYCEIGGVGYFQYRLAGMYDKVIDSDYSSNAKADGCEIDANIGTGDSPKFTARITAR